MSLASLQKIVKCAGNDDVVTLRADDSTDVLGLLFENKSAFLSASLFYRCTAPANASPLPQSSIASASTR